MSRREQYVAYLKSAEWKELRDAAMTRANGLCEFCNAVATEVHHVAYPKNLSDDVLENLVAVCDPCHRKMHGIRSKEMNELKKWFEDRPIKVINDSDGDPWFFFDEVLHALDFWSTWTQDSVVDYGNGHVRQPASKDSAMQKMVALGRQSILSRIPDDHKRVWERDMYLSEAGVYLTCMKINTPKAERFQIWTAEILRELRKTGYVSLDQRPAQGMDLAAFGDALGARLAPILGSITGEISDVKKAVPTLRNPAELITVRDGLSEQGHDAAAIVPPTRRNIEEWVGAWLSKHGCEKGPKRDTRLGGINMIVPVHTWRRADVYRGIESAMEAIREK